MKTQVPVSFSSNNHKRYEDGVWTGKNNYGANRGFLFDKVNDEVYNVSIHILDGSMSNFWDYVQMAEKPMKVMSQTDSKIILRGFGYDPFGVPFSDYGVELNFVNGTLNNVTLNMYDRYVSINYFNE